MPGNNPSPIPAIFAELNLRGFSGTALYSRPFSAAGTVTISLPTFTATQGIYEDWLDFLHGYGSESINTLNFDAALGWGGAGTITATLTSADKIQFSATLESYLIQDTDGVFGFPTSAYTVNMGPPYVVTASNNWVRGLVENSVITITPRGGSGAYDVPTDDYWCQSVITLLRDRGVIGDADDNQTNATVLEGIDNTASDNASRRIRWWVTDDGKIGWSAPTALTGGSGVFNLDADFADLIGWSGSESVTSSGGVDTQVGDYYASHCLVPSRPLERLTRDAETVDSAIRLKGGQISGNKISTYQRISIEGWIDGPTDSKDLHRHWLEDVAPYLSRGRRVSLYFQWGDPRRGLYSRDVTSSQVAYDKLYTSEKDGERGRYRGRVSLDQGMTMTVLWPSANRRRAPFSLTIQKAED